LTRPSTYWCNVLKKDVDARDKRGHDVERFATDRVGCPNGFNGNRP
jgi:hypothetical protein